MYDKISESEDGADDTHNVNFFDVLHRLHQLQLSSLFDDLTHMEVVTLSALDMCRLRCRQGKVKMSELAHITHTQPSSVSRTVKGLEQKGFVLRTSDSLDRRNTYVALTEQGIETAESCKRTIDDFFAAVFEQVGTEDVNDVMNVINRIYEVSDRELMQRCAKTEAHTACVAFPSQHSEE